MNFSTLFRLGENLNLDRKTLIIFEVDCNYRPIYCNKFSIFLSQTRISNFNCFAVIFIGLTTNLFLQFRIRSMQ